MSRVTALPWSQILDKPDFAALYQPILVSGTNLKTINGQSLLGSGDIVVGVGVVAWNDISGKPTEFPPSAHDHNDLYYTESEINLLLADYATDAELSSGLAGKADSSHGHNASEIASGTLADARLSSNVARRDLANTFSSDQRVGSTDEHIQFGANSNSTIQAWSFALGAHYQLIGDSTGGGGPMIFRMGAGASFQWQSTNRADSGSTDLIVDRLAAGSLRLRNPLGPIVALAWAGNDRSGSLNLNGTQVQNTGSRPAFTTMDASVDGATPDYAAYNSNGVTCYFGLWKKSGSPGVLQVKTAGSTWCAIEAGSITSSALLCAGTYTVGTLPSAAANAGKFAEVTDSSIAAIGNYGVTVVAGGLNRVPVRSNGTNWVIG